MKKTNILYWSFTGLFAAFMLLSALPDIFMADIAIKGFAEIGLTANLLPFIGLAKALGVVAILVPGYPRIKEWAYAGLMFDLAGAVYLIAASGKSAGNWLPVFLPVCLGVLSYHFYHKRLSAKTAKAERAIFTA